MEPEPSIAPLITIVGQTASGKSDLAVKLARKHGGEIISADSRTIYKNMDIGTAKLVLEEQGGIRHHLMDIVNPDEEFNASDFKRLADKSIADIWSRGKIPFLVGGSGLYVDGVIFDYGFTSRHDPEQRKRLNNLTLEELQHIIKSKNLPMPKNSKNKRHLVRTIEMNGQTPNDRTLRKNTLVIGIAVPPAKLKERIEKRVYKMVENGLVDETRKLSRKYGWSSEPMRSIGYAQWRGYFDGTKTKDEAARQIISSTNRFAKRQATWFKRNKNIVWINDLPEAEKLVKGFVSKFGTINSDES